MSKQQLVKSIKIVFGYCKSKNSWDMNILIAPIEKMFDAAADYYYPLGIWSYLQFLNSIDYHLKSVKSNISLTDMEVEIIIDTIENSLRGNLENVITLIPLKGATISQSVKIDNIYFLKTTTTVNAVFKQPISEADLISEISRETGLSANKLEEDLELMKRTYSKDILINPIMVVTRRGQFDELSDINNTFKVVRNYFSIIRLLCSKNKAKKNVLGNSFEKCEHYFTTSIRNVMPSPMRCDIDVDYDFDFFIQSENQEIFKKITKLLYHELPNPLRNFYFQAIKFYNWSINGKDNTLDDVSKRVLFTLVSAETLLLFDAKGEMKSKLANIMVELLAIPVSDKQNKFNSVIEVYKDRSGLVHKGKQDHYKYIPDIFTEAVKSESLDAVSLMMAQILTLFPDKYFAIVSATTSDKYLDEWKNQVKRLWPIKKHKWYQIIGLWLIEKIQILFCLKESK